MYKRDKRNGNLNKQHILILRSSFGRSLVRPWFLLGLWQQKDREGKGERNLKKMHF